MTLPLSPEVNTIVTPHINLNMTQTVYKSWLLFDANWRLEGQTHATQLHRV